MPQEENDRDALEFMVGIIPGQYEWFPALMYEFLLTNLGNIVPDFG